MDRALKQHIGVGLSATQTFMFFLPCGSFSRSQSILLTLPAVGMFWVLGRSAIAISQSGSPLHSVVAGAFLGYRTRGVDETGTKSKVTIIRTRDPKECSKDYDEKNTGIDSAIFFATRSL